MPTSTRKKARVCYVEPEEEEFDDDDLLDDSSDQKPPAKKKARKTNTTTTRSLPPFEILPHEVLEQVMLYLDSCRDIYSLSMCGSKHIRGAISEQVVVRSALFEGGTVASSRITQVVEAISNYEIHMPSTFRLLRLLNSRQCERMDQCFAFQSKTNMPSFGVRGMHLCRSCVQHLSSTCHLGLKVEETTKNNDHSAKSRAYQLNKKGWNGLSMNPSMQLMTLAATQVERCTGERVGPVVDAMKYFQVKASQGISGSFKGEGISAEYEQKRAMILGFFNAAKEEYPKFQEAKRMVQRLKNERAAAEFQRERDEELAKKLKSQQSVLERLGKALKDCEQKEAILDHRSREDGLVQLKGPSLLLIGEYMDDPSRFTNKKMWEVIPKITKLYHQLDEHGFINDSGEFVVPPEQEQELDRVEKIMYRFVSKRLKTSPESFLGVDRYTSKQQKKQKHATLLSQLSAGRPFEAVVSLMNIHSMRAAFQQHLERKGFNASSPFHSLFSDYWKAKSDVIKTRTDACATVVALKNFWNEYRVLHRNYRDYRQAAAVQDWLNDTSPDPDRAPYLAHGRGITKATSILRFNGGSQVVDTDGMFDALRRRDFETLLVHHIDIYRTTRY